MHLNFEPVWNWLWITLAAGCMVVIVLWSYPARVKSLSQGWRWTLIGLRLLAALILIFTMFRPSLQISEVDKRKTEIVVLMDGSRSMSTRDAPGGLTRRQALLKMLQDNREQWDKLAKEIDLKLYDFAGDLAPVESADENTNGELTAIGKVLDELRENARGDRLASLLLLSDGAQRAGGDDDVDPLLAARRLAEENGVPIHPVVFGTSELSASGLDLAIEEMVLDQPVTFERKLVPVRLLVRLQGAAGRNVKVRLLMEDRTGKANGESGPLQPILLSADSKPFTEIRVKENSVTMNVDLSFVAEMAGEYKIAGEVVPEEGEIKLNNNLLETLITVRKGGLRVAYLDSIRLEQKFLRQLNDTAKIQLDMQFVLNAAGGQRTLLDRKMFDPGAYDVYLIGDLPAEVFQLPDRNLLNDLALRVREGAGLGMLGGVRNFGSGGYAGTPLAELLPVRMTPGEKLGPTENPSRNQITHPVKMLPTRDGERRYLMQLSTPENDRAWRQLPVMSGATRLTPKSGAVEILAESEELEPLLIAADTGRGRVLALGVDETWRWHLKGYRAEHQRFWQQVVLWLARKEFDSDQPIWARVEPRNFAPYSRVPIEFGAQDSQGQPIPDAQYTVEVMQPDGKTVALPSQRLTTGGLAEFSQSATPGDYWVRVSATKDGQSLGLSAQTRFVVDARDLEMDNPAADHELMNELAALTGGAVVAPENFGKFLTTLLEEGIPADLKRYRRINLWDGYPLLLLFTAVMTLEWSLRKWKGLV
ncbi:hypothetical protein SH661x_000308 [Planctomicrobium sp. SH661]|uniref:hypothetical protein n=1 Tax=Planctomicrobium sp. SH661 TaxID=3448124 RepID=UPI003F5B3EA7